MFTDDSPLLLGLLFQPPASFIGDLFADSKGNQPTSDLGELFAPHQHIHFAGVALYLTQMSCQVNRCLSDRILQYGANKEACQKKRALCDDIGKGAELEVALISTASVFN